MKKHILVYGGTELTEHVSAFMEDLSYYLLSPGDIILVTGGFVSKTGAENAISTDSSVLRGVSKYAKDHNKKLEELIEAWLPDPDKDRKEEGVKRFPKDTGVTFKVLTAKTSQARRLKMVNDVDGIVTVSGKKHTELVLDLAVAINKPAYPLPITEGDSRDFWKSNEEQIKEWFDISDDFANELKKVKIEGLSANEKDNLIKKIGTSIHKKIKRRCLILMDFKSDPKVYDETIEPAVETAGYEPIRIDKDANAGNIFTTFLQRLKDCDAIIGDITEANPNVMYELGYAHAQGYSTMLICRKKLDNQSIEELPFYLKMETIEYADTTNNEGKTLLRNSIKKHLNKKRGINDL